MAYKEPPDPLTGKGRRHSISSKTKETTSIISSKTNIDYARTLGESAFKSGKPEIPNEDNNIMVFIKDMHFREAIPYLEAWTEGWETMQSLKESNIELFKFKLNDGEKIDVKPLNTSRLYYGSDTKSKLENTKNMNDFSFTDNLNVARTFGKYITEAKIDIINPYIIDAKGKDYSEFKHSLNEIIENHKEYDGIIIKNCKDAGLYGEPMLSNYYIPFKVSQIKVFRNFLYLK